MEVREHIRAVRVMLYCDECGARMKPTGTVIMTHPAKHPHRCPDCGFQDNYDHQYPYIDYEDE